MKYGMRKPSWKKSLSARTIGRAKRNKTIHNSSLRQTSLGWLHPKRALYNRVYRRTTFSIFDLGKMGGRGASNCGCCIVFVFILLIIGTLAFTI